MKAATILIALVLLAGIAVGGFVGYRATQPTCTTEPGYSNLETGVVKSPREVCR